MTAEIAEIEKQRFGAKIETAETAETDETNQASEPLEPIKPDFSITQILSETSAKSDGLKSDLSVTQILNQTSETDESETADEITKPVKPVQIKRFTPSEKPPEKQDEKKIKKPVFAVTNEAPSGENAAVVREKPTLDKTVPIPPTPDKKFEEIVTGDIVPVTKPAKPSYLLPEEKERLQKLREEELLEKELALEAPDELIDGINPYDVKNIETPAPEEIVSVKMTQDVGKEQNAEDGVPDKSERSSPEKIQTLDALDIIETPSIPAAVPNAEGVKEYKPGSGKSQKKGKEAKKKQEPSKDYKEELNITPLLENLNKSLAKKRKSDIDARRTLNVDTLSSMGPDGNYKAKTLPAKLNIDYKKQIIEDSAVLQTTSDIIAKQIEERELVKKKKRKIRDFILEDIDDDDDEFEFEEEEAGDYDGYDSSGQIWQDLNESHKGLKWRFALLFLLTAGLAFFTFAHDMGQGNVGLRQQITNKWFGADNVSGYASALVFANLIAGVMGMCLCSRVILVGLRNLFLGRADCDSACAVPCVAITLASLVHITSNGSTSLIEQNKAHLYVGLALAGLMFNTLGKILMIVRAKRNFRFISGDSVKYSAFMPNMTEDSDARAFTKGILNTLPAPVFLRKTEFLTDYLKNSYCTDWADLICRKLVPLSLLFSVVMGGAAFFLPFGNPELTGDIRWAFTAGCAFMAVLSPFSIMFLVNNPLLKAAKSLSKNDCVVMGYSAAQKFSRTNAVVIDASILFPAGSVKFLNVKRCQKPNAISSISIDESIIIAASLAIKGNSIMSSMFYDMISGDSELLYKIENCIYEVNMGITGWMGPKRIMLGNRAQMKHHGIDVPAENKERKHCPENGDVVYLAVGSETVAMFFIEVLPNSAVKNSLWELDANGVALAVKSKDSLVTVAKLADIFELNPEKVRILPYDQHTSFDDYSSYTSRGNSEIACNGTFTSFAKALVTAKTLIRDMMVTSASLFVSVFVAGLLGILFVFFTASAAMSGTTIMIYNLVWLVIMFVLQALRRY